MNSSEILIITKFVQQHPLNTSKEIYEHSGVGLSYATVKRLLQKLIRDNKLESVGNGKATRYRLSAIHELITPIDVKAYFQKEIDERKIDERFNFSLIGNISNNISLFTEAELYVLSELHKQFRDKISKLTDTEYTKEMERLAIDLSWKSSQIEGNTYSLLETEQLLKERITAEGKTQDEAIMLLNHKAALDFLVSKSDYIHPLTVSVVENIHSILVKDLHIDRNIRKRSVGISGTNYKPLDNEFQIREALESMCNLVNNKQDIFSKAVLVLSLISYIQPFADGNKRTARILSNALLLHHGYCPLSFRTVDPLDYKKAMLIFYEQNNISAVKNIFMEQFEFAVKTYF